MTYRFISGLSVAALLAMSACTTTPDATARISGDTLVENRFVQVEQVNGGGQLTDASLSQLLVREIGRAQTSVDFAASRFAAPGLEIADALLAAAERGVRVRVIGDVDHAEDEAFVRLEGSAVEVVFGDGELFWSPGVDGIIRRPGEDNRMNHNFMVVDNRIAAHMSGGFDVTGRVKSVVVMAEQRMARDFQEVFEQLVNGVFSTDLTRYDAVAQADTNNRVRYMHSDGITEIHFSPQEPLIKEMIDLAYLSRSNVWVASPELNSSQLANALIYKAQAGFDVRVVVRGDAEAQIGQQISRLRTEFDRIASENVGIAPQLLFSDAFDFTAVVTDNAEPLFDGPETLGRVLVQNATIMPSLAFLDQASGRVSQPGDIFSDGSQLIFHEQPASDNRGYTTLVSMVEEVMQGGAQ